MSRFQIILQLSLVQRNTEWTLCFEADVTTFSRLLFLQTLQTWLVIYSSIRHTSMLLLDSCINLFFINVTGAAFFPFMELEKLAFPNAITVLMGGISVSWGALGRWIEGFCGPALIPVLLPWRYFWLPTSNLWHISVKPFCFFKYVLNLNFEYLCYVSLCNYVLHVKIYLPVICIIIVEEFIIIGDSFSASFIIFIYINSFCGRKCGDHFKHLLIFDLVFLS